MFDTSILKKSIKKQRMRNDQERCRLIDKVGEALMACREAYGIREAYIVGSLLLSRRWDQDSDVDVAVGGCSTSVLDVMKVVESVTDRDVDVIDLDLHPFPDVFKRRGRQIYG